VAVALVRAPVGGERERGRERLVVEVVLQDFLLNRGSNY
jgi:hypothetical protein